MDPFLTFQPGRGLLYRLSPGNKLVVIALFSVVVFLVEGAGLMLMGFVVLMSMFAGRPIPRPPAAMYVFLALVFLMAVFQLDPLGFGEWEQAAVVTGRLAILLLLSMVFYASTSPVGLRDAVAGIVLRAAPERGRGLVLALTVVFSFLPLLFEETRRGAEARRARGYRGGHPVAVATSLLSRLFDRAEALGDALLSRGALAAGSRPRPFHPTPADILITVLSLVVGVFAGVLDRWVPL